MESVLINAIYSTCANTPNAQKMDYYVINHVTILHCAILISSSFGAVITLVHFLFFFKCERLHYGFVAVCSKSCLSGAFCKLVMDIRQVNYSEYIVTSLPYK